MTEWRKLEKGIRVRLHPTRKHGVKPDQYFVIRYSVDGKHKQEALGWASEGWTLVKVRAELAKLKEAARTGVGEVTLEEKKAKARAHRQAEQNKPTIAYLWDKYNSTHTNRASIKTDLYNSKYILNCFSNKTPDEIFTSDIDSLRSSLEHDEKSPQTVKHILSLLKRIIRFGAKRGLCTIPDISKLYFNMPIVDNIKTECLTEEQAKSLFKALDEDKDQNLASLMRLALVTGMRRGALLGLKWDDIDFNNRVITLRGDAAKNGKTTQIPMTEPAFEILKKIDHLGSPFVFPGKGGKKRIEVRRFTTRIKQRAGLPEDFRPLHGLRHTYASWLASSGKVPLFFIQRLLTHGSPQMTQRYAHLADSAMRQAASTIEEYIHFSDSNAPEDSTAKKKFSDKPDEEIDKKATQN